jgi:integrase/recombinase XerC/integrase/recombinase XerD
MTLKEGRFIMAKKQSWAEMEKSEIPLTDLKRAFEVYNRTTNKSPRTIHWYNEKLELFQRFLGPEAVLADIGVQSARSFIADLQGRESKHANNPFTGNRAGALSSSYVQGFARALRAFATWLYEDGYTDTNVLKTLKPPKIQQKVKVPLTDDEVRKFLTVPNKDEAFGARNYAALFTLLDCGLRASELCDLEVEDAHLDQGYLKVLGKGNKDRLVPIGHACAEALANWRDRFRSQFDLHEEPYLFLDANGGRWSLNALELLVRRTAQAAGLQAVHCHLLRHTFATNYLVKEVGDPLRLQQILGHTSLEMVRRYVAMASIQQSLIDRRASPMDLITSGSRKEGAARLVQPKRPRPLRVVR